MTIDTIDLLSHLQAVRQTSLDLCRPLRIEDYVAQPVDFVSPPKWNLAHTSWFFETFILQKYVPAYTPLNTDYAYFFNSYYESLGKRVMRPMRGNMTRPTTEEVYAYRAAIDAHLNFFLENEPLLAPELHHLMLLGIHHEQQHQELLLTDLKYILGHNPLFPAYLPAPHKTAPDSHTPAPLAWHEMPEGVYEIGYAGDGFCFDNEQGAHKVFLHAYRLADRLITNAEYLQFIQAGGYQDFRWWLGAGWDWVCREQISAPLYWQQRDGAWYAYQLRGGLLPLDLAAPVTHISFYEAEAFARWLGKRLPTEQEWEAACRAQEPMIPTTTNFLEDAYYTPTAAANHTYWGNAWQWTNSAYLPYPYYRQAAGALGEYNGKFMINQMVLRGGSCATPRSHIRASYRNFFHPHERWQFTGLRLAEYV